MHLLVALLEFSYFLACSLNWLDFCSSSLSFSLLSWAFAISSCIVSKISAVLAMARLYLKHLSAWSGAILYGSTFPNKLLMAGSSIKGEFSGYKIIFEWSLLYIDVLSSPETRTLWFLMMDELYVDGRLNLPRFCNVKSGRGNMMKTFPLWVRSPPHSKILASVISLSKPIILIR